MDTDATTFNVKQEFFEKENARGEKKPQRARVGFGNLFVRAHFGSLPWPTPAALGLRVFNSAEA
jgi:hypothetical protein